MVRRWWLARAVAAPRATAGPIASRDREHTAHRRPATGGMPAAAVALVVIVVLDLVVVGRRPLLVHGVADEVAHVLTAFIWYTAGHASGLPIALLAMLAGAVVLDVDHVPLLLGWVESLPGTTRPGTHSLLIVALLLLLAAGDRTRRRWWAAAALGALAHLWRDLGTGAVPLLWPLTGRTLSIPYGAYLAGTAAPLLGALLWATTRPRNGAGGAPNLDRGRERESWHG